MFVAVSRGAPEIAGILDLGFREGPPNVHQGQGTACRRIFFENAYLELVWLEDAAEASSAAIERTGLASRIGGDGAASRLGVALRPVAGAGSAWPVATWPFQPPYLPAGTSIPVAANSGVLGEPLLFFLPGERRSVAPDLPHPNGARRMTGLAITLPGGDAGTPELEWLRRSGCVRIEGGPAERLVVELDRGTGGRSSGLDPAMPLSLTW